jgi:hypothetical protein
MSDAKQGGARMQHTATNQLLDLAGRICKSQQDSWQLVRVQPGWRQPDRNSIWHMRVAPPPVALDAVRHCMS